MNKRMLFAGSVIGFILTIGLLGFGQLTGFVVAGGEQTINFNQNITNSTLIPIQAPEQIESFLLSARYTGVGGATLHLVTENETLEIDSYYAPETNRGNTILLGRGGTTVELPPEGSIRYTHVFNEECGQACSVKTSGPYYLQVAVSGGELVLSSATYTTAAIVAAAPQPPEPEPIEIPEPEPIPTRENLAPDCSSDLACPESQMCYQNYCISETGHFNVTDGEGNLLALFDKNGRILLRGSITEQSTMTPPTNSFKIENSEQVIAWITREGDMHLLGTLQEQVETIPIVSGNNFVIENEEQAVCSVLGATGELYTINRLAENTLQ